MKFQLTRRAFKKGTPKAIQHLASVWATYGVGGGLYLLSGAAGDVSLFGYTWTAHEQLVAHTLLSAGMSFLLNFFYEDDLNDTSPDTVSGVQPESTDEQQ